MGIACLGWGSLVWNPDGLPVKRWHEDGPPVRVEFARQSDNGRMTLVLDPSAPSLPSLWALMNSPNLTAAKEALRLREGMGPRRSRQIGSWTVGEPEPELIHGLCEWAAVRQVEAVIWTALPSRFNGVEPNTPTQNDVLAYLAALRDERREVAESYIRRAPRQISTPYRRAIELTLGWTHQDA